jgi:hypothetical protein
MPLRSTEIPSLRSPGWLTILYAEPLYSPERRVFGKFLQSRGAIYPNSFFRGAWWPWAALSYSCRVPVFLKAHSEPEPNTADATTNSTVYAKRVRMSWAAVTE